MFLPAVLSVSRNTNMTQASHIIIPTIRNRFHVFMLSMLLLTGALVAPNEANANEQQWGHWRGPTGNGESLTATPPKEFGPDKNCRWKQPIPGRGSSSPVVWDDQVFITTAIPVSDGRGTLDFRLLCYDRKTGTKQWDHSCIKAIPHEGTHSTNGYASASPCTNGRYIYAHFGSQGLYCLTMEGEPVWSRDFGDMHTRNEFG